MRRTAMRAEPSAYAGSKESRRADSNRGPLHHEYCQRAVKRPANHKVQLGHKGLRFHSGSLTIDGTSPQLWKAERFYKPDSPRYVPDWFRRAPAIRGLGGVTPKVVDPTDRRPAAD